MLHRVNLSGFLVINIFSLLSLLVLTTFVLEAGAMEEDPPDPLLPYLFFSAENTDDIQARQAPTIVRSRFVKIDFNLLSNPKENFVAEPDSEIRLILNIFKSIEFSVLIYKIKKNRSGSYSWYGKLQNVPMGTITLVVNDGMVFGNISKPNFTYQIRPIADGIHVVYEIDPSKFPPFSEPLVPNLKPGSSSLPGEDKMTKVEEATISSFLSKGKVPASGSSKVGIGHGIQGALDMGNVASGSEALNVPGSLEPLSYPGGSGSSNVAHSYPVAGADDGSMVDMLVVYTPEALAEVGGNSAVMDSLLELEESATNEAYANSGIVNGINVVHKQKIEWSEGGCAYSFECILAAAQNGDIPGLHELRDTHGADLVHVIIKGDGSWCGLAYIMQSVVPEFEAWGFGTTATGCFSNYTFAHEIGHNMGARHDRDEAKVGPEGKPFTYNFGYIDNPRKFRTIMAYGSSCVPAWSCTGIQYFSNPDVSYDGGPTGIAEGQPRSADNRKTHNNTALTASNFRISIDNLTLASIDERNAHRVIAPYWQSDGSSYSFIAATHPSLDGLAPQIGVTVKAVTNRGVLFGSAKTFTIEQGATKRIFIARRGHPSINSNNLTGVELITGRSNFQHGFVHIEPIASNPEISAQGFRDVTMLSFWGAIVIEANTTGFGMEFIGDMQDSAATPSMANIVGVSGVN